MSTTNRACGERVQRHAPLAPSPAIPQSDRARARARRTRCRTLQTASDHTAIAFRSMREARNPH